MYMKYDVYISSSRRDYRERNIIVKILSSANLSYKEYVSGYNVEPVFYQEAKGCILECRFFLCILSGNYCSSSYVKEEFRFAKSLLDHQRIIPIVVDRVLEDNNAAAMLDDITPVYLALNDMRQARAVLLEEIGTRLQRHDTIVSEKNTSKCRIFISYKRVDKERVFSIKEKIEKQTGWRCWIDLDGIESDAYFTSVIIDAVNNAEVFLFMYSSAHLTIPDYESDWTIREIMFAHNKKKRIVFINIDKTELTDWFLLMFGLKQRVDASSEIAMERLCLDIKEWLG